MKPRIDEELIGQLCDLARIRIDAEEAEVLQRDLARLVEFVGRLEELPPDGIVLTEGSAARRVDQPGDSSSETLLDLSSHTDGHFVRIPPVIDSDD